MPITLIDEIQPKNNGDFPMVEDVYFKGGFRVVADTTARDAITAERKTVGMVAHVVADGNDYRWNGTGWDLIVYSGSAAWGSITGTLSSQTDLQTALDAKVAGPASSTDNAVARYDSTTGKIIQNSTTTIADDGSMINAGIISASLASSGANVSVTATNSSATPDSNATLGAVTSVGGGSPKHFLIQGSNPWSQGIDASDGKLKKQFTTLSFSNPYEVVSNAGIIQTPLQPSFRARIASDIANVTGDGTAYTLIFGTEDYDTQSEYNTSTGVFTASATGVYLFNMGLVLTGLTASHTSGLIVFNAPSGVQGFQASNYANMRRSDNLLAFITPFMYKLNQGETITFALLVSNGTKVVSLRSAAQQTFLSGHFLG